LEPRYLYVQDCTLIVRLPCQWEIQDV
jgi:hypothetical protein